MPPRGETSVDWRDSSVCTAWAIAEPFEAPLPGALVGPEGEARGEGLALRGRGSKVSDGKVGSEGGGMCGAAEK